MNNGGMVLNRALSNIFEQSALFVWQRAEGMEHREGIANCEFRISKFEFIDPQSEIARVPSES